MKSINTSPKGQTNRGIASAAAFRDAGGDPLDSDALAGRVRDLLGNDLLLSFSRGKDSLAMWLWLREQGFTLYPFYLYLLPDHPTHEADLAYYEDFFGQHILRLPSPRLYNYLAWGAFMPPQAIKWIDAARIPMGLELADMDVFAREYYGLPRTTPVAAGFRAGDNQARGRMIRQGGAVGLKTRKFYYAIWDWNIDRVADIILKHEVALSGDYDTIGRTAFAMHYQYLKPQVEARPEVLEAFKRWYPLIEAELFRHDVVGEYARQKLREAGQEAEILDPTDDAEFDPGL